MFIPVPELVETVGNDYVIPLVLRLYGRYPLSDRIAEFANLREVVVSELGLGGVEFKSKVVVKNPQSRA